MKSLFWIFVIYSIFKRLKGISKPNEQKVDVSKRKDEGQLYLSEGKESDVASQFEMPDRVEEVNAPVLINEKIFPQKIKQETNKEITFMPIEKCQDNDLDFDSDSLREGVLWAEILGPPRSKRSLGFKNYN